jgi:D-sedoheptulose 7-phosphate isomerase
MVAEAGTEALTRRIDELLARRTEGNRVFFSAEADALAACCHRMAQRFARGGKLVALGVSPAARSDARHVAVEFVHPVIVGKRALPAIGLAHEGGPLPAQLEVVAEPADIAIGYGLEEPGSGETRDALSLATERGLMTISFSEADADWTFVPDEADPFIRQELIETLYHVLWESVHVFFERLEVPTGHDAAADPGESGFLYPFLSPNEQDPDAVVEDVRSSVLMKAEEIGALREQTLTENRETLAAGAYDLRRRLDSGAKLLAFGNGGSATDAMDLVADFRAAPGREWRRRRAIDLTEDAAILTAIANDIGTREIFQRQVIAYGQPGDVAIALSTSGNSPNIIAGLAEARRRGLGTVALVGYDGGRVASESLADHVVTTRSQHIPRIQEAQASAYHVLRELVELVRG